jgi:2-methylisocitrate lyase-like PEP mutase family enzyme
VNELAEAGAKRISIGGALARLAYGAVIKAGREMKDAGTFSFASEAIGFAELENYFAPSSRR